MEVRKQGWKKTRKKHFNAFASAIHHLMPPPPYFCVQCNCRVRVSAPAGAAGALTSTDTSLLDYRRDVSVARPHGG
jgi:hypothetical protein